MRLALCTHGRNAMDSDIIPIDMWQKQIATGVSPSNMWHDDIIVLGLYKHKGCHYLLFVISSSFPYFPMFQLPILPQFHLLSLLATHCSGNICFFDTFHLLTHPATHDLLPMAQFRDSSSLGSELSLRG